MRLRGARGLACGDTVGLGGNMTRKKLRLAAAAAAFGCLGSSAWGLEVTVVSSSPQLVTGGDALLQITGLTRLPSVSMGGRDVRVDLRTDPKDPGKWLGVL